MTVSEDFETEDDLSTNKVKASTKSEYNLLTFRIPKKEKKMIRFPLFQKTTTTTMK